MKDNKMTDKSQSLVYELDLVQVATAFSKDDSVLVGAWMKSEQVGAVEDAQALKWIESDADVWAVTVAPFVLVQSIVDKKH